MSIASRLCPENVCGESARSTPGSGLGLSLVQAVAYLHGGVLRLEDNHPGLRAVLIPATIDGGPIVGDELLPLYQRMDEAGMTVSNSAEPVGWNAPLAWKIWTLSPASGSPLW